MFRHKYLKYKKKYLDLKNSNLKGGGQPIENSSTPIEENNLIGNIEIGLSIVEFDSIIESSNFDNLVGALEYFTRLNDDDFKHKFIFLKKIIEKIINDETINEIENEQIKEKIKGLLITLGGKINNLRNSMTGKKHKKDYFFLYNDINNYFKRTYNNYLNDYNTNSSSISSSSISSSSSSKKSRGRKEVFGFDPSWRRRRREQILGEKRAHSKEEFSIPIEEKQKLEEYIKKKQTQIEFNATIVEK